MNIILGCNLVDSRTKAFLPEAYKLGINQFDTAEIYDDGKSELLLGEFMKTIDRNSIKIHTKVSAEHLGFQDVMASCEKSLSRLNTEYIDLYYIHWPNKAIPIEETLEAFLTLKKEGKIKEIGISNYSLSDLKQIHSILKKDLYGYQGEFNRLNSKHNYELLAYCKNNNIMFMGYSLFKHKPKQYSCSSIINWAKQSGVTPIIRTYSIEHLKNNLAESEPIYFPVQEIVHFQPNLLKVLKSGNDRNLVYKTLEDALANTYKLCPPITDMQEELDHMKPVRVIKDKNGKLNVVEGAMRYWAWYLFRPNLPVPCIIVQENKKNNEE